MSTLKSLIPAEFFVKPTTVGNLSHGKISIQQNGKILVEWPRDCKIFKQNLEAARKLKEERLGTYAPQNGGWIFHRNAAELIDSLFPDTLVRTPDFLKLVDSEDGKIVQDFQAQATPTNTKHGSVTLNGGQFLVVWGKNGPIPRDLFARYLANARAIKTDFLGSIGWNKSLNGWLLSKSAASQIVELFPADKFDHCEELANVKPVEPTVIPQNDELTNNLLNAADALFASFE